ncbi:MAG: isocitrate lyase/phosphoenolpyruvate mutase family protein [Pseudomonadales bacterium]
MNQTARASDFTQRHIPGQPVVLFNAWDAGSAKAIAEAGASAIATGSWSVAGAQGFPDGQQVPLHMLLLIAARICESVDLPVTIDFEGAYNTDPDGGAENVEQLMSVGACGINFEDQIIGAEGLHEVSLQSERIRAIREKANSLCPDFFINARTDVFLKEPDTSKHSALFDLAAERATAYAAAGASGFFVPGLVDPDLIKNMCQHTDLPVNIMMKAGGPAIGQLAELGVARVSYGPGPFVQMLAWLQEQARLALTSGA